MRDKKTQHSDIMVLNTGNHKSSDEINRYLDKLAETGDAVGIKKHLKMIVPEDRSRNNRRMIISD